MRIYLGGPMFKQAEVEYNLRLAQKLRSEGFIVYCPNENSSINDKSRTDITGPKIYRADITQLEDANVFLCQVSEDSGTNWEAGYMDCLARRVNPQKYYGVIGLATDIRLLTPVSEAMQGIDNQTMYVNQFVIGGIKLSLGVYLSENSLIIKLKELMKQREEL